MYPLPDYAIATTAGPSVEPVTLAKAKLHGRIEQAADDDLVRGWVAAARQLVEKETGLRLLTQTVAVTLAAFPACGRPIELPVRPVQSVSSVSYRRAEDGADTALTGYGTWLAHQPPLVGAPADGWPATKCDGMAAVTVTAVVGWASDAAVPAQAVQAMYLCLAYWNGFRGDGKDPAADAAVPGRAGLPAGAVRLIEHLRRREYR